MFSRETRQAIEALVVMAADTHAEKISSACLPMKAQLEIENGKL